MEEKQHEKAAISKLNIVRAQVFFLLSTLSEDKWESNVNQLKEVQIFLFPYIRCCSYLIIFFF